MQSYFKNPQALIYLSFRLVFMSVTLLVFTWVLCHCRGRKATFWSRNEKDVVEIVKKEGEKLFAERSLFACHTDMALYWLYLFSCNTIQIDITTRGLFQVCIWDTVEIVYLYMTLIYWSRFGPRGGPHVLFNKIRGKCDPVKLFYQTVSLWKCWIFPVLRMMACRHFSNVYFLRTWPAHIFLRFLILHLSLWFQQLTKTPGIFFYLWCGSGHSPHEYTLNFASGLVIHLVRLSPVTCFMLGVNSSYCQKKDFICYYLPKTDRLFSFMSPRREA